MRKIFIILFLIPFYISAQYLSVNGKYVAYNGKYVKNTAVTLDADATLYITNAGITDPTEKSAIYTLVASLKSKSLWVRGEAMWIFFDSYNKSKLNLFDPRDLDVAFRLTEEGTGITYTNAKGANYNGTGTFNTHYTPSVETTINDMIVGCTITEDNNGIGNAVDIGGGVTTNMLLASITSSFFGANFTIMHYSNRGGGTYNEYFVNTGLGAGNNVGIYLMGSNHVNKYLFRRNGITISADTKDYSSLTPDSPLYLGSYNANIVFNCNSSHKIDFIFKGLSRSQCEELELIIYDFYTALGITIGALTREDFYYNNQDLVTIMGESIAEGWYASDRATTSYFALLCAAKGWTGTNLAKEATTLIYEYGATPDWYASMWYKVVAFDIDGNYALCPRRTKHNKYMIVEHGLNECFYEASVPTIFTPARFSDFWDDIIIKLDLLGWSGSNVVVIGENYIKPAGFALYSTTEARYADFVAVNQAKCTANGFQYISVKAAQFAGDTAISFNDDFHPNDIGHQVIATYLQTQIP